MSEKLTWTFLTNHAHVLVCIAEEPDIRGKDVAARVGITERAAQSIIADLVNSEYVTRRREGRRNRYQIHPAAPLRHPIESDHTVGDLLTMLGRLRSLSPVAPSATQATPAATTAKKRSAVTKAPPASSAAKKAPTTSTARSPRTSS